MPRKKPVTAPIDPEVLDPQGFATVPREKRESLRGKLERTLEEAIDEQNQIKLRIATMGLAAIKKLDDGGSTGRIILEEHQAEAITTMATSEFAPASQLERYREILQEAT